MRLSVRLALVAAVLLTAAVAALAGLSAGRGQVLRQRMDVPPPPPVLRGAPDTDQQIADLQTRIARGNAGAQVYTSLGAAYLQKARESGDPAYYSRAEAALKTSLDMDAGNADTFVALGTLALVRHHFEEALSLGERARELNPYKAAALRVIADAQVELGRYPQAADTVQAMVNLRPDLSSYARVSYLRELFGDVPGAIEAMDRAVTAGAPGTEALAWTRVQLGHLHFSRGDLSAAEAEYERTLVELPGYLHARAGLARVRAARGEWAPAIAIYEGITTDLPVPEYVIALAEVQRAAGNAEATAQAEALVGVIDRLYRENGINTDLEMALFAADRDIDIAGTVERAHQAAAARPSIQAYDALAWALYKAGRYEEAMAAAEHALRLGTRDSLMRFHAGMIAAKLGQRDRARTELRDALTQNPHFSLRYADEAARTLRQLDGSVPRMAGR